MKCSKCGKNKHYTKFPKTTRNPNKRRSSCNSCRYKREKELMTPERLKKKKATINEWARKNKYSVRYKSLCHFDKKKFQCKSLSIKQYKELISKPCFYCNKLKSEGVDRKNSNLGHTIRNCVPCCEKCNNILGDLPYKAKLELKNGLFNINKKGLLKKWEIPTKRKKKK